MSKICIKNGRNPTALLTLSELVGPTTSHKFLQIINPNPIPLFDLIICLKII